MWGKESYKYIPRHGYIIRVFLNNGDYVDYDDRAGTFRYITKDSEHSTCEITDEDCREIFSRNLSELMRAQGIGRSTLSDRTGLSQVMLSKYMTKKATPSLPNIKKIARVLNCGLEELLE
jgi:DNA-binding Xre family transcriptional regulator